MIIGIPVYDDVDMLDVTGPFEMFDWAGYEIDLIAEQKGMKRFRNKGFRFEVTKSFADARAYDAIWVPGGDPKALAAIIDNLKRTYLRFPDRAGGADEDGVFGVRRRHAAGGRGTAGPLSCDHALGFHPMFRRALSQGPGRRGQSPLRARPQSADRRRDIVGIRRSLDADSAAARDRRRAAGPAGYAILSRPPVRSTIPPAPSSCPLPRAKSRKKKK